MHLYLSLSQFITTIAISTQILLILTHTSIIAFHNTVLCTHGALDGVSLPCIIYQ